MVNVEVTISGLQTGRKYSMISTSDDLNRKNEGLMWPMFLLIIPTLSQAAANCQIVSMEYLAYPDSASKLPKTCSKNA